MLMKSLVSLLIINILINSIYCRLIEINIHYHVNSKNDTDSARDSIRIFPSLHHDSPILKDADETIKNVTGIRRECFDFSRSDYQEIPGLESVYKMHNEPATWNQARKICKNEGATLSVINSNLEAEAVVNFVEKNEKDRGYPYVYLGYHDLFEEGEFVMLNDEPLEFSGYVLWAPGEPNGHKRENCGSMLRSGLLNDISCSLRLAFICEKSVKTCQNQGDDDDPNPTMIDWRFDIINPS